MSAVLISLQRPENEGPEPLADDRYRALLGEAAWMRLPASVRRRFSRHLGADEQIIYRGEVVCLTLSRWGWLLAQAARLAGAPLPFTHDGTGPSVVIVTESEALGGQIWSRSYPRPGRFPQVIHSAKRFTGPTGLEEYLGWGLVMRLRLSEEEGQLVFRSAGYAVRLGGLVIALPRWLSPGACTVSHRAETDDRFSFTLTLDHSWLGRLVQQVAFFSER
jgi:hypothetical protein